MKEDNYKYLFENEKWNDFFDAYKKNYLELINLVKNYNSKLDNRNDLRNKVLKKVKEVEAPIRYISNDVEMIKRSYKYGDYSFNYPKKTNTINKLTLKK